jgi:hypothetical protein
MAQAEHNSTLPNAPGAAAEIALHEHRLLCI